MKIRTKIVLLLLLFVFAIFIFGCENLSSRMSVPNFYEGVENLKFENAVRGKVYYEAWDNGTQTALTFDVDKNEVIFDMYYWSNLKTAPLPGGGVNWDGAPLNAYDFIYTGLYKYIFMEDLNTMGAYRYRHYSKKCNKAHPDGFFNEEYSDVQTDYEKKNFEILNSDATIIKWGYTTFYTKEALEAEKARNYGNEKYGNYILENRPGLK